MKINGSARYEIVTNHEAPQEKTRCHCAQAQRDRKTNNTTEQRTRWTNERRGQQNLKEVTERGISPDVDDQNNDASPVLLSPGH